MAYPTSVIVEQALTREEREHQRVYEMMGGDAAYQERLLEQARERAQYELREHDAYLYERQLRVVQEQRQAEEVRQERIQREMQRGVAAPPPAPDRERHADLYRWLMENNVVGHAQQEEIARRYFRELADDYVREPKKWKSKTLQKKQPPKIKPRPFNQMLLENMTFDVKGGK